jgi:Ca2+-binding EF-hand superfamily protein
MRFAKLVFVASAMALAVSGAYAADKQAKAKDAEPGFNNLDKNHDGYVSRTEAAADKDLAKKFKEADTNNDGKLSRAEYLKVKGKEDVSRATEKVKEAGRDVKNKVSRDKSEPSSSAGATSSSSTTK